MAEGLEKQQELAPSLTRGKEYISTRSVSHIHAYYGSQTAALHLTGPEWPARVVLR